VHVAVILRTAPTSSNTGKAIVCDAQAASCVSDMFRAGWRHCASGGMWEWALGGRTVAGVVGGVECSDGEELGAYSAAVWLCVTLMQTCVWCLRAAGLHCASACV
jgi:hypothetical protein